MPFLLKSSQTQAPVYKTAIEYCSSTNFTFIS